MQDTQGAHGKVSGGGGERESTRKCVGGKDVGMERGCEGGRKKGKEMGREKSPGVLLRVGI